mgnify:CR=1 FL=1
MGSILQQLGLTENEQIVYETYLTHPEITAAEVSRIADMDKSSAYRAVERLEQLGALISNPQQKGTTYTPASPEFLRELLIKEKKLLESKEDLLERYIQESEQTYDKALRGTTIRVETGVKAIQKAMDESLDSKEKLIRERFRGNHRIFEQNPWHRRYVVHYANQRVEKGVKILQLEHTSMFDLEDFREIMTKHNKYNKEVRLLPHGFDDMNSLRIWDDTFNLVSFDENDDFIIITIKDKYVAQFMKNQYDFVWERSEPLPSSD